MAKYIVTAKTFADLESLYTDLESHGGSDCVPDRCIECVNRRPISRNTVYELTEEEAVKLGADPRVLAVELDLSHIGIVRPRWTRTGNFNKSATTLSSHLNWGLARSTAQSTLAGWGHDGTPDNSATVTTLYDGTGVDVVIVDGFINPDHPEFAVNEDGTGGSRVNQFNWFSLNPVVTGGAAGTYVYAPSGYSGDYNFHGTHVAGITCGNRQGWASKARIFNIYPYEGLDGQGVIDETIFDYLRAWHNSKGNSNPTIVNNSWGKFYAPDRSSITSINWRGTTYTPGDGVAFSDAELDSFGIVDRTATYIVVEKWRTSVLADLQDAIDDGIVFVGAAGNYGTRLSVPGDVDYDNTVTSTQLAGGTTPFLYHRGVDTVCGSNAICVGLTDYTVADQKRSWSACGPRTDLYAPGSAIMSASNDATADGSTTVPDPRDSNYYLAKASGTSMASPQVAGMLALVAQQRGSLNQAEALEYLKIHGVSTLADPAPDSYTNTASLQGSENNWATLAEYSISVSATPISPNDSTTFTITSSNIPDGTSLSYSVSGTATASDFDPASTTGTATVTSNTASIVKTAAAGVIGTKTFALNFSRTSNLLPTGGIVAFSPTVTITGSTPPPPPPPPPPVPMTNQTQYLRQNVITQYDLEVQGTAQFGSTTVQPVAATNYSGPQTDATIFSFNASEYAAALATITVVDTDNTDIFVASYAIAHNGTTATISSAYGQVDIWDGTDPTFSVNNNSGTIELQMSIADTVNFGVAVDAKLFTT